MEIFDYFLKARCWQAINVFISIKQSLKGAAVFQDLLAVKMVENKFSFSGGKWTTHYLLVVMRLGMNW